MEAKWQWTVCISKDIIMSFYGSIFCFSFFVPILGIIIYM